MLNHYAPILRQMLKDPSLEPMDIAFYLCALFEMQAQGDQNLNLTAREWAMRITGGMSPTTALKCMKRLGDRGYLVLSHPLRGGSGHASWQVTIREPRIAEKTSETLPDPLPPLPSFCLLDLPDGTRVAIHVTHYPPSKDKESDGGQRPPITAPLPSCPES